MDLGPEKAAAKAYPLATPESQERIAREKMSNPEILLSLSKEAELIGLRKRDCIETIKEGLKATKLYGKESVEHPDHSSRLHAAEMGIKIHGGLLNDRTILPIPVTKEQYNELCMTFWGTKPK